MKFPLKTLSAIAMAGMAAISAPYAASASETIEFTFKESDLATPSARESLLARIERVSSQSCRKKSTLFPASGTKQCKDDLKHKLIEAIGDKALTSLAASKEAKVFRSASR